MVKVYLDTCMRRDVHADVTNFGFYIFSAGCAAVVDNILGLKSIPSCRNKIKLCRWCGVFRTTKVLLSRNRFIGAVKLILYLFLYIL